MTDGGDPPVVHCTEHGEMAFISKEWRCALCDAVSEGTCVRSGNAIPVEEIDSPPLCGYCSYISHKDD